MAKLYSVKEFGRGDVSCGPVRPGKVGLDFLDVDEAQIGLRPFSAYRVEPVSAGEWFRDMTSREGAADFVSLGHST